MANVPAAAVRSRRRATTVALAAVLALVAGLTVTGGARADDLAVSPPVNTSKLAGNQVGTSAAVDPNDPERLAVASSNDSDASTPGIFFAFSTDGGETWSGRVVAGGSDDLPGACCDPELSWDGFGNLFLVYMTVEVPDENCALGRSSAVLARSTDGGATFPSHAVVLDGCLDQPKVTTGPGIDGALAVWVAATRNNAIVARGASVTGLGQPTELTWQEATELPDSQLGLFASAAVGPDGETSVAYVRRRVVCDPSCRVATMLLLNTDPDGLGPLPFRGAVNITETRTSNREVTPAQPHRGTDAQPSVAYDRSDGPDRGRLYLVYVDKVEIGSTDLEILLRTSDDDGASWTAPVRVNDDGAGGVQLLPAVSVDQSSGRLGISFRDTRLDAASGNDDSHVFATWSDDGGETFHPNQQVTPAPSNAGTATGRGLDYGDYSGNDFAQGVLLVAWPDNSNSTGDNPNGAGGTMDLYAATVTEPAPPPPPPPPPPEPGPAGYWLGAADGGVFAFAAPFGGSMSGVPLNGRITGIAADPSSDGYWLVGEDGGVFALGGARFFGSLGGAMLPNPVVGIASTVEGDGYWIVTSDGAVFAFGAALSRGSRFGRGLAAPIVGMAADQDGEGYWLVGADGGVFAFAAPYHGSLSGTPLAAPVSGVTADPDGEGYWLVGEDGGVFAFRAPFWGSLGGARVDAPVVGLAPDPDGAGYWLAGADGGLFAYRAPFSGSARRIPLRGPVTGIAAHRG